MNNCHVLDRCYCSTPSTIEREMYFGNSIKLSLLVGYTGFLRAGSKDLDWIS